MNLNQAPHLRLDRLMKPAGLVQSAAMYSVILKSGSLYFIKTGPGWNDVSRSGFQKLITNWVIKRQKTKIERGERELTAMLSESELAARASLVLELDLIEQVELIHIERLDHTKVKITSKLDEESYKFEAVDASRFADVNDFFVTSGVVVRGP